jgi:hypothetical protein
MRATLGSAPSATNGGRPARSVKSVAPNEYTSDAADGRSPSRISGAA